MWMSLPGMWTGPPGRCRCCEISFRGRERGSLAARGSLPLGSVVLMRISFLRSRLLGITRGRGMALWMVSLLLVLWVVGLWWMGFLARGLVWCRGCSRVVVGVGCGGRVGGLGGLWV